MKQFVFLIVSFLLTNECVAQLMQTQKGYSRADTLRGSLSPLRSCYDVISYDLNLQLDFDNKYLKGHNTITFKSLSDWQALQLDLYENMKINRILMDGKEMEYSREGNAIFVKSPTMQKRGWAKQIIVHYEGSPTIAIKPPWDGGFTWTEDENKNRWLGVSCEGMGASLWWPCKDHLSDEPDSVKVSCTIPKNMMFVGNGTLCGYDSSDEKTNTICWRTSYPINTYNVTLNIGDYVHFNDIYTSPYSGKKLNLEYWVLSYNLEKARKQFLQVNGMMDVYEKYIGPYPFWNDDFKLVETPYLGMEHQSAIAYGNKYQAGYLGNHAEGFPFDYIIIHESGHEWFGNAVSCADVADLWIHESFTTYCEAIYVEGTQGYERAVEYINNSKKSVGNKRPIQGPYGVNEEGSRDMYPKGSLMLNSLRTVINNDSIWWGILRGMAQEEFRLKQIAAEDVYRYFNQKSGMDIKPIMQQYVEHASIPILEYRIVQARKKKCKVEMRWKVNVEEFKMPVIAKTGAGKWERIELGTEWKEQQFEIRKGDNPVFDQRKMYFDLLKSSL